MPPSLLSLSFTENLKDPPPEPTQMRIMTCLILELLMRDSRYPETDHLRHGKEQMVPAKALSEVS